MNTMYSTLMVVKLWSECELVFSVTFVCLPPMATKKTWDVWRSYESVSITAEAESAGCCLNGQQWMMTPCWYHTPDEAWRRCSLLHHITASIEERWWGGLAHVANKTPLCLHLLVHAGTAQNWSQLLDSTVPSCGGKNCQGRINAVTGNRRCVSIIVLDMLTNRGWTIR